MKLIKHAGNIHELKLEGTHAKIAMFSDLHWDNPKCDWKILKKDLDYCVKESIPIMINGDMFCLMQGRGDNRKNKSDIRPEHNNAKYLDSIVETAVEWFTPYSHLLTVVGYGNHETAIIKFQETDILARFVKLLNLKNHTNVQVGGYGGWLVVNQVLRKKVAASDCTATMKIRYFHGSGGGGVVTKGALNLTRALEMYEDFDVFTMGHIHENAARNDVRDTIVQGAKGYRQEQKQLHMCLTGTYKEEYGDGSKGWHVERGAPIKPIGGRILTIDYKRVRRNDQDYYDRQIDSLKFPL
jgi:Icc-related predicted phosphoesterase